MTKVCVDINGKNCRLTMEGHATGNELVCAAASAIAFALSGYLLNAGSHVKKLRRNQLESGSAVISCTGDECVAAAFRMAGIGLAQIAQQYPDHMFVAYLDN